MSQRFYEEEEAERILQLAARKSTTGGMSRDRLLSTAAELGITPEAVEEAERTLAFEKEETGLRAQYDRHVKGRFYSDFGGYLVTCGFLVGLNLYLDHGRLSWSLWVVLIWGFHIASELVKTFIRRSSDYERGFEKWKRRQATGSPSDAARDWLASHPGDAKGAADHLRDSFDLGEDEAWSVVRGVRA